MKGKRGLVLLIAKKCTSEEGHTSYCIIALYIVLLCNVLSCPCIIIILKCKAEKLYMYSARFTFLSPELCASFREIQILTGLIPAAVYWFPLYRLALFNLLDHST